MWELLRYRLAVQRQIARVKEATEQVRAERQRMEDVEYELVFAPSMSMEAFTEQLQTIHHRDTPFVWGLKTEGEFLLDAAYGMYRMALAVRSASTGSKNACIQRAIAAFEREAPDADLLRHLHVHSDAYLRGQGHHAHKLPDPMEMGAIAMLDAGPVYWIGRKLFVLFDIADAAEELGRAIVACADAA
jgi:hypothetical protein